MNIKKIFLLPFVFLPYLSGCNEKEEKQINENNFTDIVFNLNTYRDAKSATQTSNDVLRYSDDLFLTDNSVYNPLLAKLAVCLSAESYDYIDCYIKENDEFVKTFFSDYLNFKDKELLEIDPDLYSSDKNDLCSSYAWHYEFDSKLGNKQVFIACIRGTALNCEWASNFDIGIDNSFYLNDKNQAPEWTNKNHHKGFDVTTNRFIDCFNEYFNKYYDSSRETIYFVTGHSRGASIANLYGAYLNDLGKNVFTYTFATPSVTSITDTKTYNNIFNILNDDDIVPISVPNHFGFKRYGIDKHFSISTTLIEEEKAYFSNREYANADLSSIFDIIIDFCPSHNYYYSIPSQLNDLKAKYSSSTYDKVLARKNKYIEIVEDYGLDQYFSFSDISLVEDKYQFTWKYAPSIIYGAIDAVFNNKISIDINLLNNVSALLPRLYDIFLNEGINIINNVESVILPHVVDSYVFGTNYIS